MIYNEYTEAGDFGAIRLLSAPYLCRLYRLHCFLVVSVGLSVQVALRHWLLHAMALSHRHLHAIRSCMPFGSCMRFSLADACDSLLHALQVALSHSRLFVIAVHLIVAFALASINISTGSMHAFVCVWVCVSVWGLVCLGAHVACCLAPPTCLSCTHIYTYTHAHTHSLVGVGISGGYIVGHVMPVEEEWVRHTL